MSRIERFLPLVVGVLVPITFGLSFTMARLAEHISGFVYISDTGTLPPESCYFGQMLNLIGFLNAINTHVMHKSVDRESRYERLARWCGFVSSIGLSMVGNFQELNIFPVHALGALAAFGGGSFYMLFRTMASRSSKKTRYILLVITGVSFFTVLIAGAIGYTEFTGGNILKWEPEDGGYVAHAISAVSEWIMTVCFVAFMITQYQELSRTATTLI